MIIKPLHKIEKGYYYSHDEEWFFRYSIVREGWFAYKRLIDGSMHYDNPYFFSPLPTLKSLLTALEKAKP